MLMRKNGVRVARGRQSLLLALCFALTSSLWAQVPSRSNSWGAEFSEQVKGWLQDALVPGISIAILEEGRISWEGAFGMKNAETGEPVTETTVFEAASLSKPVFAYGVLRLVDKGVLDLDKPLADYIGSADMKGVYPPIASATDVRWKKITARMVLTHRAGFPNWFNGSSMSFRYEPGQRFSYSGEGFSLLAASVVLITGRSLNEFIQESVFDPLQMKASCYVWRPDYDTTFTASHNRLGQRTARAKRTQFMPGASLYTTAGDYARFLLALGTGAGLSEKTWREMTRSQVQVTDRDEKPCFSWGLGVGIHQAEKDITTLWHWGDNGDMNSYFEIIPDQKRGVVFFMNGANAHAITPLLARRVLGISRPAITTSYFRYDTLKSPTLAIFRAYRTQGIAAAIQVAEASPENLSVANSPEVQGLMTLAGIMVGKGEISGAKVAVVAVLRHQPASIPALVTLGGIHLFEGNETAMEASFRQALQAVHSMKDTIEGARVAESSINSVGYRFLNQDKHDAAIKVFKFNVASFPASANVYDSLGEAYMKSGNKQLAIDNYRKALELAPGLPTAKDALLELQK